MPPRDDDRRARTETTSQALLRLSNRGPPRTEFLREASTLLLAASGAEALVAWLEDGERTFLWRADPSREPSLDFAELETDRTVSLLERALRAVDPKLAPLATKPDGVLIAEVAATACERPFSPMPSLAVSPRADSLILLPFEIDQWNNGALQLEAFSAGRFSPEDVQSLEPVARLLGIAIANRRAQAARAERVKELACMYSIARIEAGPDLTVDDTLQQIVELLPPAWQYPALTTARIVAEGQSYVSHGFAEGPHRLSAEIRVRGVVSGRVDVFYREPSAELANPPLLERAPFLPEEHNLIDGVARAVASIVERKRTEAERSRLQEQVRHADRLATIGQLAAGVAHELNEPLANILGFAQLALKAEDLPDHTSCDLRSIVTASLYAREIIKKLMFFARQAPSRMARVDLDSIVTDGLALLAASFEDAGVSVQRTRCAAQVCVLGDPAQLQQVLVNLVVNAIQAMPDGGLLSIATSAESAWSTLEVMDTGAGVPKEHMDKLFEPFFTTKDVGEGTGLGLAVVHGIVTAHGGHVEVESELGHGTRFRVLLPRDGRANDRQADP